MTRDYDEALLDTVADASQNDNSGQWIVSAQQQKNNGVPDDHYQDNTPGDQAPAATARDDGTMERLLPAGSILRVFPSSTNIVPTTGGIP